MSPLHSATILTHTIACSHTFFSETKYFYSRSDVKSELVPFSAIPRSRTWKSANLQTLKIHRKLTKIATTIIFRSGDQEKKEIYTSEKKQKKKKKKSKRKRKKKRKRNKKIGNRYAKKKKKKKKKKRALVAL